MPAILTSNFSVINAENFIDSFVNGGANLYVGVGRGYDGVTPLPDDVTADDYNKWPVEANPPTPQDTLQELCGVKDKGAGVAPDIYYDDGFMAKLLCIKKVLTSNVMIMVPRVDWVSGNVYAPIDETILQGKRARNYYVLNSKNEVWRCVKAPKESTDAHVDGYVSVNEPKLGVDSSLGYMYSDTKPKRCSFKTISSTFVDDGYEWEFLYDISSALVNGGMLLANWMPVCFNKYGEYGTDGVGGTLSPNQIEFGDVNANRTLGAYRVLVTATFDDEGAYLPYDSIYRQVGLLMDPLTKDGENRFSNSLGNSSDFKVDSGLLVYLENRKPTMRTEGQSEVVELLCVF